jgi:Fe-S cluster biogenesis protein NfuA
MFIQTETTSDPAIVKFLPGRDVYASGPIQFADIDAAARSPLAARLLNIDDVIAVELGAEYVSVTKRTDANWLHLKPAVLGAIMDHFVADLPVMSDAAGDHADNPAGNAADLALDMNDPIVAEISELIDTRIRPAATQGGGDVVLRRYDAGTVYVEFTGSAFQLKDGVENMLRHYVPEVVGVADWRDALPKPGLDTPEAVAIQDLLETSINPSVASHGGHISLIDIDGARAYIRMEGGCQGCGMADVTLKQGVQVEIQKVVPTIREVLDVTDHAGGTNPYYQSA